MAKEFLGTGWSFPVRTDVQGGLALSRYDDDVKQAIGIILGTALGERVMRPDFGCAVYDMVFDPADAALAGRMEFYVKNALEHWEPRIIVRNVAAEVDEEKVTVDVEYTVRRTNTVDNVVYPFVAA